jgi:hypothetical protein
MMMTDQNDMNARLEAEFAAARRSRHEPSLDLMARVLSDALAHQPRPAMARAAAPARAGFGTRIFGFLGGWAAMGGLATATIVGFWIGIRPPDMIETPTNALFSQNDTLALVDADLSDFSWNFEDPNP